MRSTIDIDTIPESSQGQRQAQKHVEIHPPLTVLDLLILLRIRRRFLGKAVLIGAAVGLALAFLLPTRFTAITTILPPSGSGSLASAFIAQAGELGALAGLAGGGIPFHNPADTCMIMLRSRSVEDATIQRFHLMQEYGKKRLSDTRTTLERKTSITLNPKSGVITISAEDPDPARAAELANGYVDEFRKFSASMAITEASQRRLFFEQQLLTARGALTEAEEAMKHTQQTTGMLEPVTASKAILESAVAIRAQIAARQVQLRTMRTYAAEENPGLMQLKQEIAGLQAQLSELTGTGAIGSTQDQAGDPLVPKGKIPEAGAEYLRSLRDVKYNEAIVALLARQLEIARLDEAKQGAVVQVIDPAVTPDKRSFPKRFVTLLASTIFAFCFACFWAVYASREPDLPMNRIVINAVILLVLIFSSFRPLAAQVPDTPNQSVDCSTSSTSDLPDPSCAAQEQQGTPVNPANPMSQDNRLRRLNDSDRPDRSRSDTRFDTDETPEEKLRTQNRRINPAQPSKPPQPHTEFEQMAADSAGRPLAIFGHLLFAQPPETFAPVGDAQVPSSYSIGPGDELRIRMWGQVDADLRIVVDRAGQIYIPHVGGMQVAGVRYGDLEGFLKQAIEHVYKNFNLSVAMGRLHSIQVFVVGQAKAPGAYTISSLSTLVNAIFASGGPTVQGSLRHIQLKRGDNVVQEFDLYDLLVKGDKSHDVSLQSGDVVFIPPVGPLVAVGGSVNGPAIFELKGGDSSDTKIKGSDTLGTLIETAGGLSSIADGSNVTVERIRENQARTVSQFPLDASGLTFALKGGDIIHVSSIVPRFDDTITLRGYVSNPGRFPFRPGMHVRDLLPNPESLLPREYWLNRASITDGRQTEYPIRKQVPETPRANQLTQDQPREDVSTNGAVPQQPRAPVTPVRPQMRQQTIPEYYTDLARSETVTDPAPERTTTGTTTTNDIPRRESDSLTRDLRKLVPSVNWRYALIQRVDASTLKTQLISFDLGKAIIDNDPASNLALQPGDIVTAFSQQDIVAPQQAQTRYVKVEGEVEHPGVYELAEGQTIKDLLESAGGLTAKAYPYGARLTRESSRIEQQHGLDEMVRTAEAEMRASTVSAVASSAQDSGSVAAHQNAQQTLLASLRTLRASGRVVLAMSPDAETTSDFPPLALEDSDRLVIPPRSDTVTVSGAVYNPASFVFDSKRKVGDYLYLAGKGGPNSNQKHAFVLRADGTVISRQEVSRFFHSGFDKLSMNAGDQIVVPEKVDDAVLRALHDWPQILSPLALSALAIATVAK